MVTTMVSSSTMKIKGRQKGARRGDFTTWIMFSVIVFIYLFATLQQAVFAQNPTPVPDPSSGTRQPVDADKVKKYVLNMTNEDMSKFTYEQLEGWFVNKSAAYKFIPWEYPRAFPFCVTRNQIIQGHTSVKDQSPENMKKPIRVHDKSHLYEFERVFHYMELRRKKYYQFEPKEDSMLHNKTFIKDITFSRINTPEPDMVNLRQWVHVKVEMAEKMQGLYMQTIVGPFGLPFGEFSVEFACSDDLGTKDIAKVGELSYCSYRPRANIYHPSVYVGVDKETDKIKDGIGGRKVFHVHFKWFDLACMETPYVQFLMLAVKEFKTNPKYGIDFVAQMSPVFLNTGFDSKDGSPYPYYPGFENNMFCFLKSHAELQQKYAAISKSISTKNDADRSYAPIQWTVAQDVTRIQPNEEYDDCILFDRSKPPPGRNVTIFKQNEVTYECGPGPLRCDKDYSKVLNISGFRGELVTNETVVSKCIPCGIPECIRLGFDAELCNVELPEVNSLDAETNVLTNLDDNFRIRNHGVGGMLSFLYLIPVGNVVGRFYKEIMGKCLFGNGPWIFTHIVCSLLSLAAIWSSMGPMVPKLAGFRARQKVCRNIYNDTSSEDYASCMESYLIKSPHTVIGLIAYILVHFVPIFGFIRPSSNKLRFLMSTIHSYLGYFTHFLGVLAVCFAIVKTNKCVDTLIFASIMITLPIIFSVVLFVLDGMSDKIIGVKPPRKQCPVLEQLQMEGIGPLSFPKMIVLAAFVGLMTLTWVMALISLHVVAGSGDSLIEGDDSFKGAKGKVLGKLQGIFGQC